MSGTLKAPKLLATSLATALTPCLATALEAPGQVSMEQVDPTHLGEVQEGTTHRASGIWTVQVGAYVDPDKAEARLNHVAQLWSSELIHAARLVTPHKWDENQTVYRARFAGLSHEKADALCAAINRAGEACFVSRDDRSDGTRGGDQTTEVAKDDTGTAKGVIAGTAPTAVDEAVLEISPVQASFVGVPEPAEAVTERRQLKLAANDQAQFEGARQVNDTELSDMRGGFFTAGGLQFDFGASIRTLVNGQLALQTNLTWTPTGPNIQQLSGLGQSIQGQVQADLANAGISTGSSPGKAASAIAPTTNFVTDTAASTPGPASSTLGASPSPGPPATTIAIPNAFSGVAIPSPGGGSTQVLANISANQIQNIVINSASNQNINQNTNVTLTVYNFAQWQQLLAQHALSSQIINELMSAPGFGR